MLFNSFQFLWLFPLVFVVYYAVMALSRRSSHCVPVCNAALLVISYLIYLQYSFGWTLILLYVTVATYVAGRVLAGEGRGRRKLLIWCFAIMVFLPLGVYKYFDFVYFQLGPILSAFNIGTEMAGLNWAVPLGISFYTFQAVGYVFDVYYRRIEAERNFMDYMLFVAFFPQLMSGPISKASSLLPQIKVERRFNYGKAVEGCKLMLWGFFLKVVFADQIGLCVDIIINSYPFQSGLNCAFGAVMYSLQIYGDFAGYSLIAVGVGKLMGFDLVLNFNRPYFAVSITNFWRRWHISLTRWLTDYVYIPLGGSRCSKAKCYRNILVTFLVSGIWHGANWTFIVWGGIHGVLQMIEKWLGLQKAGTVTAMNMLRTVVTFLLVTLAWVFFRADTVGDACAIIAKMFTHPGTLSIPSSSTDKIVMTFSIATVWISEWFAEYRPQVSLLSARNVAVRWCTYLALLSAILLCGIFDAGSFIYVNF